MQALTKLDVCPATLWINWCLKDWCTDFCHCMRINSMPLFPSAFLKIKFFAPLSPSAFARFFSTGLGHQVSFWQGFQNDSNQEQVLTFLSLCYFRPKVLTRLSCNAFST